MDSTSSKVTVEYHDPAGVFSLVSHDIASRLPLRNLNWQSSQARPLRQIKSLHLDFVPDQATRDGQRPTLQISDSGAAVNGRSSSVEGSSNGAESKKVAVRERRHQIPGLQTSPYLKIYVLRCDDKDIYKATERQKLREWIKDEAAAASAKAKGKGKGENHDAFEWLILHVVIPDTVAASESRWRVSQKDTDELKERKAGAKWPGKSTRTVFDKLRADFNESGKSAQDRVAQIRLLKRDTPADLLPTPPAATTLEETADEREKAWNDLMTKLKNLILEPFDRRVRQYESDIAEQESRRSLPGFNFCTFFIHKEGLAKALESIGLVEDALMIYDELSLGLETVLRDMAAGNAQGTATTFAPYTDDIVERVTAVQTPSSTDNEQSAAINHDGTALFDKDFRQKIVTSTISVFDFHCYLFSRQRSLILRLANTKAARARLGSHGKDGGEDFVLTSEVCWRASAFIHNAARVLRRDLRANKLFSDHWNGNEQDIENIVCSWTYAVSGLVLDDTSSSALDHAEVERGASLSSSSLASPRRTEFFSGLGANPYPQRSTSLLTGKPRLPELSRGPSFRSPPESEITSPPSSSGTDGTNAGAVGALPGMPELATYRAELVMLRRKMLEHAAKQRGWAAGWVSLKNDRSQELEDVNLGDDADPSPKPEYAESKVVDQLQTLSPALKNLLQTPADFYATYEQLSDVAMRYYLTATQTKSAESIMGDLAIVKSQQGDFEYAARYFQHVLPIYSSDGWSFMETEALRMHCKCLLALDRKEQYVRTVLNLLAKVCLREKVHHRRHTRSVSIDVDYEGDYTGLLAAAIAASETLPTEVVSPADRLLSNIMLERVLLRHLHQDRDGFSLRLRLEHVLEEPLQCDAISGRLVHHQDPSQEVWLTIREPITLQKGTNELDLETNTVAYGPYYIDRVEIQAKKLRFVHEYRTLPPKEQLLTATSPVETPSPSPISPNQDHKRPWILVFPAQRAFNATIDMNPHMQVDRPRSLQLRLESGWNDIQSIDLKLKPASAGLRLHLADATRQGIEALDSKKAAPGQIQLGPLAQESHARIVIPYSLEQTSNEISIRFEAHYRTPRGEYSFVSSAKLSTALLLDVNVKDTFHLDALLSEFTVKTANGVPLAINSAALEPSAVYDVEAPSILPMPMTLVRGRPIKLFYKIKRKQSEATKASEAEAALKMSINYRPLNEMIIAGLQSTFATALRESSFGHLTRLILQVVDERAKGIFSNTDLEMAALLEQIRMPTFEELGWDKVVSTLATEEHSAAIEWLKQIHEQHSTIPLPSDVQPQDQGRCITISVDVPSMDIVHRASLSVPENLQRAKANLPILTVGQPVLAHLQLEHTRAWSTDATFVSFLSVSPNSNKPSPSTFVYEVSADADTWLIGGQRRAQFEAAKGASSSNIPSPPKTFEMMLFPLRAGILPLPTVDVRPLAGSPGRTTAEMGSCETHCASAGQVVQVMRDARTTRVEISEG